MKRVCQNYRLLSGRQATSLAVSFFSHLLIVAAVVIVTPYIKPVPKLLTLDFSIVASSAPVEKSVPHTALPTPARPQLVSQLPLLAQKKLAVKSVEKMQVKAIQPVFHKKAIEPPKVVAVLKEPDKETEPIKEFIPETIRKPERVAKVVSVINEEYSQEQDSKAVAPEESIVEQLPSLAPSTPAFHLPSPAAGKIAENREPEIVSQYNKAHFNHIKTGIQQNIRYPRKAQRMGWEGKVVVEFTICQDGTVKNIHIVESSGFKALDKNAVATIEQAAPFPIPPIAAKLIIPVVYRLS